jgi:hypothetical protein
MLTSFGDHDRAGHDRGVVEAIVHRQRGELTSLCGTEIHARSAERCARHTTAQRFSSTVL